MNSTLDITILEKQRNQIRDQFATIGDLRPGSLNSFYRKCGRPNCRCAREGDPGHGPRWSLTRKVGGTTVIRAVRPDAVEQTRN